MTIDVTSLLIEKDYIHKTIEEIELKKKELAERIVALQYKCPHHTIKIEDNYYGGGYDYLSIVKIKHICTICEKVVKAYNDPTHKGNYG